MSKNKGYAYKAAGLKVEDIDEASRKVKGYLSAFNQRDSDKDVILPGAFKQSLNMRGPQSETNRKIAFLRMHDWTKQIGRMDELEEDNYGLRFIAVMGRSSIGEDALRDYQDGIIREHSIGFEYLSSGIDYDESTDTFMVSQVKLWEGSAVTFGANENTPVLEVSKMQNKEGAAALLYDEMSAVINALKNGKGTDDRLYNLEMRLRVLQTKYHNFLETLTQPSVKDIAAKEKESEGTTNLTFLNLIANL